MDVMARYLGGSKFEVAARGHRVICDQPFENGGSDEGMSPPELLLASLATCAAYYATQYLNHAACPPMTWRCE
jgi:putative redox protein